MKIRFDSNLDYQLEAIESVCDLFQDQEKIEHSVTPSQNIKSILDILREDNALCVKNKLTLSNDKLFDNLTKVQARNGLPVTSSLKSKDFTIEMETGTGKTYVYLRTIFELNKRNGFTKFIVVVPSVAIKEGVYKTLQMTREHFRGMYKNTQFEYFIYNSSNLEQIRNFYSSQHIQIMVVTVGSINKKDVNNLYKDNEKTGGDKPINLIKATNPIIIIDEPQSVDGGLEGRGKEAIDAMGPLCTLRYSATHVNKYNMIYRLDAIDAYEKKLVKQIEVASASIRNTYSKPYVRFVSVISNNKDISANVEIDVFDNGKVKRAIKNVRVNDLLDQITKRNVYEGYSVGSEIISKKGKELLCLQTPNGEVSLKLNETCNDIDELSIKREMIRRTIREHLDKEKRLNPLGIKVLSLFFIDSVDKYRIIDDDGTPRKGEYAKIFEEEYLQASTLPEYQSLFSGVNLNNTISEVHNGYFSIDKTGHWTDTSESTANSRENAERAYNLIMKDKESLLSLGVPLKFIFSHSALKEGWDNPNVFQICTLRDMSTERERRQTIGRGLRLCVNQAGNRIHNSNVNVLTVIATENYEQFAQNLQKEIETDTGIRFGVIEKDRFMSITTSTSNDRLVTLDTKQSETLWSYLKSKGYIDSYGRVQDSLRLALANGSLSLPEEFESQRDQIVNVLSKSSSKIEIHNADERKTIRLRENIYSSNEFKTLWNKIKYKTTYVTHFDSSKFVDHCIDELQKASLITKVGVQWKKASIIVDKSGIVANEKSGASTVVLDDSYIELSDLIDKLQERTSVPRDMIIDIMDGSRRIDDSKYNPQQFVELVADTINYCKQLTMVDDIEYQKLNDNDSYDQALFQQKELTGYVKNLFVNATKSLYEDVICDSENERNFVNSLEKNESVKLYVKLPGWYKVQTPLGSYNPDWAIWAERGSEKVCFVVETKTKSGKTFADLRLSEKGKTECGARHFKALSDVRYMVATTLEEVLENGW